MKPDFDLNALISTLIARREAKGISWREVARQAEIDPSTLTRIRQGQRPDIATFGALVRWLGEPAETFLGGSASPTHGGSDSPLAPYLGQTSLTPKQTAALADLLKAAYHLFKLVERRNRRKAG